MRDILSLTGLFYRSDDDYDEAIGTLLSIGASVLKVAGEKILEYYNSSEEMFNNFMIILRVWNTTWDCYLWWGNKEIWLLNIAD